MDEPLGYCAYCKNAVWSHQKFVFKRSKLLHRACKEQRGSFYDSTTDSFQGREVDARGRCVDDSDEDY